jgi:hypothetical protein
MGFNMSNISQNLQADAMNCYASCASKLFLSHMDLRPGLFIDSYCGKQQLCLKFEESSQHIESV